jgi:hypothetical protein
MSAPDFPGILAFLQAILSPDQSVQQSVLHEFLSLSRSPDFASALLAIAANRDFTDDSRASALILLRRIFPPLLVGLGPDLLSLIHSIVIASESRLIPLAVILLSRAILQSQESVFLDALYVLLSTEPAVDPALEVLLELAGGGFPVPAPFVERLADFVDKAEHCAGALGVLAVLAGKEGYGGFIGERVVPVILERCDSYDSKAICEAMHIVAMFYLESGAQELAGFLAHCLQTRESDLLCDLLDQLAEPDEPLAFDAGLSLALFDCLAVDDGEEEVFSFADRAALVIDLIAHGDGAALFKLYAQAIENCGNPGQALRAISTLAGAGLIEETSQYLAFAETQLETENRRDAVICLAYLTPREPEVAAMVIENLFPLLAHADDGLVDRLLYVLETLLLESDEEWVAMVVARASFPWVVVIADIYDRFVDVDEVWAARISRVLCSVIAPMNRASPELEEFCCQIMPKIASPKYFDGNLISVLLFKLYPVFCDGPRQVLAALPQISAEVAQESPWKFSGLCTLLTAFMSAFPRETAADDAFQAVFQDLATAIIEKRLAPMTSTARFIALLRTMHRHFGIFKGAAATHYLDVARVVFTADGEAEAVEAVAELVLEILPELSREMRDWFTVELQKIAQNPLMVCWGTAVPQLAHRMKVAELVG